MVSILSLILRCIAFSDTMLCTGIPGQVGDVLVDVADLSVTGELHIDNIRMLNSKKLVVPHLETSILWDAKQSLSIKNKWRQKPRFLLAAS